LDDHNIWGSQENKSGFFFIGLAGNTNRLVQMIDYRQICYSLLVLFNSFIAYMVNRSIRRNFLHIYEQFLWEKTGHVPDANAEMKLLKVRRFYVHANYIFAHVDLGWTIWPGLSIGVRIYLLVKPSERHPNHCPPSTPNSQAHPFISKLMITRERTMHIIV